MCSQGKAEKDILMFDPKKNNSAYTVAEWIKQLCDYITNPKKLQTTLDTISAEEPEILLEDFNTQISKQVIPAVKQRFNDDVINSTGVLIDHFCAYAMN